MWRKERDKIGEDEEAAFLQAPPITTDNPGESDFHSGLSPQSCSSPMEIQDELSPAIAPAANELIHEHENTSIANSTTLEEEHAIPTPPEDDSSGVAYVAATPLPKGKVIPLMLLLFSETFNSNSIFPYLVFMLADFHLTDDQRQLGYPQTLPTPNLL